MSGPVPAAGRLAEPLRPVTSIKVKLGLLVVAAVLVAAVLATAGAGTVPAWLGIPVTVLLALAVTQLLAVGMTSPLRQMTEAARRMAAGDYAVRVETGSTDEVGQLARAFNTMAADLGAVDRQRRDLVASVSHELRTPLAGLVAVLENVADGVTAPDARTVRSALGQAERLADLVDDLLDLSRVDAGVEALQRGEVDVRSLVDRVVEEAAVLAGARRTTVEVAVAPGLTAYADPRRLHQLLLNLLENAVRHGPVGSRVRVLGAPTGTGPHPGSGSRSSTRVPASPRPTASGSSSGSAPCREPTRTAAPPAGPGAPGWASPSPAGSPSSTAAGSTCATPSRARPVRTSSSTCHPRRAEHPTRPALHPPPRHPPPRPPRGPTP